MTNLSYILIYVVGVAAVNAAKVDAETKATDLKPSTKNRIVGVASFSGIASRNGRVSSMGGIRFFPSIDSDGNTDMSVFYPLQMKEKDGKTMFPLSLTKQANGLSSTIQVYPGSVSVSSSARSGNVPEMPWPTVPQYPMNDILFHPPMLERNLNPWFVNDMIRKSLHMRTDDFRPMLYPNFSPDRAAPAQCQLRTRLCTSHHASVPAICVIIYRHGDRLWSPCHLFVAEWKPRFRKQPIHRRSGGRVGTASEEPARSSSSHQYQDQPPGRSPRLRDQNQLIDSLEYADFNWIALKNN